MRKVVQTLLITCFFHLISCDTDSNKTEYDLRLEGTNYHWEFVRDFNRKIGLDKHVQYNNGILKAPSYFNGDLWAINQNSAQIVKFNDNLVEIEQRGKKGDGYIDENISFNHFFVEDKFYFIFDANSFVLKRYDLEKDSLLDYRYFDKYNTAITNIGRDDFYLAPESDSISDSFFFDKYSYYIDEHTNIGSINEILQIPKSIDLAYMVYDGQLISGKNYVVYYFFKVGKFLVFDRNEGFKFELKTIDETPTPIGIIETDGNSEVYTTNPKHTFFLDGQVNENKLYLLNNIAENDHHCIDIYDLNNRSYEGSIKLDALSDTQLPVSFAVNDSDLIVIYEDMVVRKYTITNHKKD
ncbi:MAG: hypothetical protein DSY77_12645 [Bacteroidetes bacterium]|nr:MAG: hypothetical protein DSY77_12645 [Bacteroidota bacterium]